MTSSRSAAQRFSRTGSLSLAAFRGDVRSRRGISSPLYACPETAGRTAAAVRCTTIVHNWTALLSSPQAIHRARSARIFRWASTFSTGVCGVSACRPRPHPPLPWGQASSVDAPCPELHLGLLGRSDDRPRVCSRAVSACPVSPLLGPSAAYDAVRATNAPARVPTPADAYATAILPPGGAFVACSPRCSRFPVDEALRSRFFLCPVPFRLLSVTRRSEESTAALRSVPCAPCCACPFTVLLHSAATALWPSQTLSTPLASLPATRSCRTADAL